MSADLSPRGRAANLARLASETFDLAIVGGGIVGAGIARDAALRGLKTALVERGDFACGTSGKTSRLIHGGLRYLKNFRVRLVRQAVRERDLLLRRSPGLVRPLAFTIPTYRGKGTARASVKFGLFLYDLLSRDKVLPRRAWLSAEQVQEKEPSLATRNLGGGGRYHDALTDDARLVLAVIRSAADAGAVVANYAEAIDLVREGSRVVGVRVLARATDTRSLVLRASVIVNAVGVWLSRPYASGIPAPRLRPTKGIHVFLPRDRVGNHEAVVLSAKRDGRMIFVLPWGTLTLVGTTDTDYHGGSESVIPDADDVTYLLESVNEAFPDARVGPEDVVSAYAGLRPLVGGRTRAKESDISRAHDIVESPDGLISVVGGKLTTQRAMAEAVVNRICDRLGKRAPCATRDAGLGMPPDGTAAFLELGFDPQTADHLASRHDPSSFRIRLDEPMARERIVPELPYLWAEVDEAVNGEMALMLQDVMVRRLGLFYETPDQGRTIAPAVAARMARFLDWTADRIREEVREYEGLVEDHQKFREHHGR